MKIAAVYAGEEAFPVINPAVRSGDRPNRLFYRGDISLLSELNSNVAVIGLSTPAEDIIARERKLVRALTERGCVIVSGLARGCDTIAHRTCLECGGKTIAILPTRIDKIYPPENSELAEEIVDSGGLLISEYDTDHRDYYEYVSGFVKRDRLQAMFSKAVVLTASYRKSEGNSGSRHAMKAAEKYGVERFVMFNEEIDADNPQFGLNMDLAAGGAQIITEKSIDYIAELINPRLERGML